MDAKRTKQVELFTITALIFIMVAVPCAHYYCLSQWKPASVIAKVLYAGAGACAVAVGLNIFAKGKKALPKAAVFVALPALAVAINILLAESRYLALWGSDRNEGGVMLLCYMLFFLTGASVNSLKNKKTVIFAFATVGILHCIYGLLQYFYIELEFFPVFTTYPGAISGVTGNPNFMGSLTVMIFAVTVSMALLESKLWKRCLWLLCAAVSAATLLLTRTLSAYVGTGVVVFVLFVLGIKNYAHRKGIKKALGLTAVLTAAAVVILIVADRAFYGILFWEIKGMAGELAEILKGNISEDMASGRFIIWKNCLVLAKDNLLTGVGIENLENVYHHTFGLLNGQFVDRAHNEMLHIMVTMGLPAMVTYMVFYIGVFVACCKNLKADKKLYTALLTAFCGYMVQAMFNISVIDVAPYFWIICGLMVSKTDEI